jgi:hypothetical protein
MEMQMKIYANPSSSVTFWIKKLWRKKLIVKETHTKNVINKNMK